MNSFNEFQLMIGDLENADIRYVLVGGVAMAFYDEPRFTEDIDLLIFTDDFSRFKKLIELKGYFESAEPWTFQKIAITMYRFMKVDGEDSIIIDALVPLATIAQKIIDNSVTAESENGTVRLVSRKDLIWLKTFRNSKQDQADVERLQNDKD